MKQRAGYTNHQKKFNDDLMENYSLNVQNYYYNVLAKLHNEELICNECVNKLCNNLDNIDQILLKSETILNKISSVDF